LSSNFVYLQDRGTSELVGLIIKCWCYDVRITDPRVNWLGLEETNTTVRWQKVFIHTPLSRAYLALAIGFLVGTAEKMKQHGS